MLERMRRMEAAQTLVEYALIIFFLAVAAIVALGILGSGIAGALYNNIITSL